MTLNEALEDAYELREWFETEADFPADKFPRSNIERIVEFLEGLQDE